MRVSRHRLRNGPSGRRSRQRGQAMVEMALIFPLLLLLTVSVFDYGYYLEHVNNITTIVRDGARYASINTSTQPWTSSCPSPAVQAGGGYNCPQNVSTDPSNTVETVVQEEAESLTVPEGGLPLNNVDCCWQTSSGGTGCPTGDGTTPGSKPTSATPVLPTGDASCMSVVYYTSSNDSYASSTLSYCGYWSADSNAFEAISGQSATLCSAPGQLVQVTILYDFTAVAPGPTFDLMGAALGLHAQITAQYALVVEQ